MGNEPKQEPPEQVTVTRQHCTRCRHAWYPRVAEDGTVKQSRQCPNCKALFWWREPLGYENRQAHRRGKKREDAE
jgi:hypothetical protein